MNFDNNASKISISGVVKDIEWDDVDDISGLEILTDDGSYGVEKNAMWQKLIYLLDTQVKITGVVTEIEGGRKRVLVMSYEPLEEMKHDVGEIKYDDVYEEWSFENEKEDHYL